MSFESKSQMRAAFGGYLGKEMKSKARTWAHETPNIKKLPMHKKRKTGNYDSNTVKKAIQLRGGETK